VSSAAPARGSLIVLGTSEFAVPSIEALVAAEERVALVVAQPDRPRGRGRHSEPPPAKDAALGFGLPVYQPEDINGPEAVAKLRALSPEFLVVVAYGQILKRAVLEIAAHGAINLHPSLLPRHRGPSPIAWAILSGDREAGSSTMILDEGMDSGPVIRQESFPLSCDATRGDLEAILSRSGGRLVVQSLQDLRQGVVRPRPQDPSGATLSRLLRPEMGQIDWTHPAEEIRRLVHALSPRPAAAVAIRGRRIKVLRVQALPRGGDPGRVIEVAQAGPVVGCGSGALVLLEVLPEGKRAMSGADFARGGGVLAGDVLGSSA
jgi:methionyl-tRNA formyltransferase